MPANKKPEAISYEDYDKLKDKTLNEAVSYLATTFTPNLLTEKLSGKDLVECVEASVPVARLVANGKYKEHVVEAYVDKLSWNHRMHGGVVAVSVVVNGKEENAELKFNCIYPQSSGQMVYEVVEDIVNFVCECVFQKARNIESKS